MKKQNTNQNTKTTTADINSLVNAILDAYELTESQMTEFDALCDNSDLDGLMAFNNRLEKLQSIQIPEKLKAIKLSDLTFDAVSVGGLFKFHYTDKAIKTMLKNNIVCDYAFCDNSIQADKMPEFDNAIVTGIDGEKITAISKENGIEYTLIPDDFDGIMDGKQYSTCKNCLFGILPFTYKTPASVTA